VDVFGCWKPSKLMLLHEVLLTGELIKNPFFRVNRGKIVDQEIRPDATYFIGPKKMPFHVEMDLATESYKVIKRRIQAYIPSREPVVWIAPSESRIDGIRSHSKPIAKTVYFKVAGSPYFYDYDGWEYLWELLSETVATKVTVQT
jgi:hypothetical protein